MEHFDAIASAIQLGLAGCLVWIGVKLSDRVKSAAGLCNAASVVPVAVSAVVLRYGVAGLVADVAELGEDDRPAFIEHGFRHAVSDLAFIASFEPPLHEHHLGGVDFDF